LFREDQDRHFASLLAYSDEEISTLELPDDPSLIPGPPIATTRDTTEVSV
jgi:hypothetical protein